jgi:hypothetical protein
VNDDQLEAALRRTTHTSAAGGVVVRLVCMAMGGAAALCGLLRVDPGMRHYSMGMWAVYAIAVALALGFGLLITSSALVLVPRRGNDFVDRVMHRPETLTRVWLLLVKHKYNPNSAPGQLGVGTSICAQTSDNKHFQFMVRGADANELLVAIAQRAPGIAVGPP